MHNMTTIYPSETESVKIYGKPRTTVEGHRPIGTCAGVLNGITLYTAARNQGSIVKFPKGLTLKHVTTLSVFLFSPAIGVRTEPMPDSITLESLINGSRAFSGAGLTRVSRNLNFQNLTNGWAMFRYCELQSEDIHSILNALPDITDSASREIGIGRATYWTNDTTLAQMIGATTPISDGSYSYKGWKITVQ